MMQPTSLSVSAFVGAMTALLVICSSEARAQSTVSTDAISTSASPLSILQAVPRVRLDDPVTPTPREQQVPPPQEVDETPEPTKKPGIVKGLIRAIPFVGPKIAGTKIPEPRAAQDEPEERAARRADEDSDVVPDYTDTQRAPTVTPARAIQLYAPTEPDGQPERPVPIPAAPFSATGLQSPSENTLTVKVATPLSLTSAPLVSPQPTKAPDFARPSPEVAAVTPAFDTSISSPTLEATDLGMPNPTYEQNEVIRSEYVAAVKTARAGNYLQAAQLFKEYAANHPSSGLAPRALFLAALLATDAEQAEEAEKFLRERFPTSRFLVELEKRNRATAKSLATPTPPSNETPAQMAYRLEAELTEAVGVPEREVPLRLRLGQAYLALEEYERALEVLRPATESSRGRAEEAEILILISECYIATHRNAQAVTLLSDVLQRFPAAPQRPRALYDYGLVSEATGNFERARTMYSELRQRWPASTEAAHAVQRLRDMDRLAE